MSDLSRHDLQELLSEARSAEPGSLVARLAAALTEDYWVRQWGAACAREMKCITAAQEAVAALHSASMMLRIGERSSGSKAFGYEAAYAESVVQKYPQYMPATWPPPWPLRIPREALEASSDNGTGQR